MKKTKGPSDLDYIQTNRANWDERVDIHLRDDAGFYRVEAFLNGEDVRPDIDRKEMHEFAGIDVLHLQCHFGLDTLSVARQAKSVVGVDFSPKAITAARDLAKRVGLTDRAEFVLSDLYATPMQVNRQFDLVFSTWGTTIWLPDIWRWGEVFAGFVKPGGRAYFADFHPTIAILDEVGGSLVPKYSWRTPSDQPEVFEEDITYTGAHSKLKNKKTVEWIHPVSDHLNALLNQGLQLEYLHEHEVIPCKFFQCLEAVSNPTSGAVYYRMPKGGVQLPLAYSMMLSRPH
ncbi:MAG TPA: class I SAM-dependent methyltransferase [Gammaproteobacteria bacterium]|nr:class I SAM-dependent methyltransferase [Gammaproteobacteria bacterium]HIM06300.1 class I SAM-dependent methyltransferase [Gammaproteobacteria bacterium]